MAVTLYFTNQTVRIQSTFQSLGVNTDPTTISYTIKDPTGAETTYTFAGGQVIKEAVGIYHYDLSLALSGKYYYRIVGTGAATATYEDIISVQATFL